MLIPYLEGSHFIVRTDHQALRWILDLKDTIGLLARWRFKLAEFSFEIVLRPRKHYKAADAKLRLPQKATNETNETADVDDGISPSCIVEPISNPNTASERHEGKVEPFPTMNELMEAQASDVLC